MSDKREIIEEPIVYVEENGILKYDKLKGLKSRIEYEISELDLENIEATEENKAVLKTTRAKFSKDFKELEEARKHVKRVIEQPYKDFLEVYNEEVEVFREVDTLLKNKVDIIEDMQREEKYNELEQFFNDLKVLYNQDLGTTINLNFIKFEQLELNITLSASMNKLKEEIEENLFRIKNEVAVIRANDNRARLFVIYQNLENLDLSTTLLTLTTQLEQEQRVLNNAPKVEEEVKDIEPKKEVEEPKLEQEIPIIEEVVRVNFSIEDTRTNIKKVLEFMKENNIVYKNIG